MIIKHNVETWKDSKYLGTLSILCVSLAKPQSTRYLVKDYSRFLCEGALDEINI